MARELSIIHSSISSLRPEVKLPLVRVGRDYDGGYVIPSLVLENSAFLFSGGYGNDFSFERDFLRKSKALKAVLYDYSINYSSLVLDFFRACKSIIFRRGHYPLRYHTNNLYTYTRLMATPNISLVHTKLSRNVDEEGVKLSDLKSAFYAISTSKKEQFFCKLDIEGYEYELVEELVELESEISGLVIEFHDTYSRRDTFLESLHLLNSSFAVAHTHVNNYGGLAIDGQPIVYEISFVNRRLLANFTQMISPAESLVVEDQPNDPDSAEVKLIFG